MAKNVEKSDYLQKQSRISRMLKEYQKRQSGQPSGAPKGGSDPDKQGGRTK